MSDEKLDDPAKLRLVAKMLDMAMPEDENPEMQADLRRIADTLADHLAALARVERERDEAVQLICFVVSTLNNAEGVKPFTGTHNKLREFLSTLTDKDQA